MTQETHILNIIHRLRRTSGSLAKQSILKEYRCCDIWKAYLYEVYNPFIVYGVTGDKTGGRDDVENLKLCRSIDAGVTAVTLNKIYPKLIPTTSKMMKAKDNCVESVKFPLWAGIKYDGNYTNIVVRNGDVRFFTSGGHEYTVDDDAGDAFYNIPDLVYMAERIEGDGKLGSRRRCNLKGSKPMQYSKGHSFKIFDAVPLSDFDKDATVIEYSIRRHAVIDHTFFNRGDERFIETREDLEEYMDEVVAQGYEGLVLKQPDMKWRNSTSRRTDFAKYKKRRTADLWCLAELPGEGTKLDGKIGSLLLVDSMGREVSVGSGLDDLTDRLEFGTFVNKVIEIEYEQIMDTYIQPVYLHRREDKTRADID